MGPLSERMSKVDTAWLRMDTEANLMMIVGVWTIRPAISLEALRDRAGDHVGDARLEFLGPDLGLFVLDAVDEVDAEVEVLGLITHDVLNLFCAPRELVLALETKHHRKRTVEKNPFHNERKNTEIFEKFLVTFKCSSFEIFIKNTIIEIQNETCLVVDCITFAIHVENF